METRLVYPSHPGPSHYAGFATGRQMTFTRYRSNGAMMFRSQAGLAVLLIFASFAYAKVAYKVGYIEQHIDHFNYAQPLSGTFKLRYLYTDEFWDHEGPVFFYTGNEGPITDFWDNSGFVFEAAEKFNALVIFGEHRYYGESLPFGSSSFDLDKVGYLAMEQALADYAVLMTQLKKEFKATDKPVVAFGGSYGGMLSAYMRFKYPNIITAALAASAPIYMVAGTIPRNFFFKAVTEDFYNADPDKGCPALVRAGFDKLEILKSQGEKGLNEISKIFKLCKDLSSADQVAHLIGWIRNSFTTLAMTDYPYPADFIAPLPAYPVNYACKLLTNATDKLEGLAAVAGLSYNGTAGTLKCFDIDTEYIECADPTGCGLGLDSLAWDYQACTELPMPGGTNGVTDMFPVLPWTLEMREEYCKKRWGVEPRLEWTGIQFWGENINSSSNIIFSNGDLDPWRPGGVLESVSPTLVALLVQGGAHHLDLRAANPKDPSTVRVVRSKEIELIRKWIS